MPDHMLNLRNFFRNRFEHHATDGMGGAAVGSDASPLTLRELCRALADDQEPFPRHLDSLVIKVFGRRFLPSGQTSLTYGQVASMLEPRLVI